MASLSSALDLLDAAVSYALAGAGLAAPRLLPGPTPCPGWDLETLLDHLCDSIGVLHEALATGGVAASAAPSRHAPDPVARLHDQSARLLAAAGEERAESLVLIGDRALTASIVAVTGAIEITVHGWDIFAACGVGRPVPPDLAAALLPAAVVLIPPETRPGLFAAPVRLPGPASPGDEFIAFLGRWPAVPGTGTAGSPGRRAAIPGDPAGLHD